MPRAKVSVEAHGEKLKVGDDQSLIGHHACTSCGVHVFGRIENKEHAFHGLDFTHSGLSSNAGEGPTFAAFVSSIIESGTPPTKMDEVRQTSRDKGLEPYDCLSPGLMDLLATHAATDKGIYREA